MLKGQLRAIEEGDLRPEHVSEIAVRLMVPEHDVVTMNRRMVGPDHSLNAPISDDSEGEWQDRLRIWICGSGVSAVEAPGTSPSTRLVKKGYEKFIPTRTAHYQ